jgi:hypothetical protein
MMLINAIHKSPYRAVIAVTGGGSEVIGNLLRHGNGSATLIEAIVPYGTEALDDFLGGKSDKYCSAQTARSMAMRAYQRAVHLTDGVNVVGVGATCKLAKGVPERAGRSHEIYVAAQTDKKTVLAMLDLKIPRRREDEESVAASLIMKLLAGACGVESLDIVLPIRPDLGEELLITESKVNQIIQDVVCGKIKVARIPMGNELETPRCVFPGSFNPLHKNHIAMAKYAHEKTGYPVDFEISVENPDKPALDYISIQERLNGFKAYAKEPWMGSVYLTSLPLFAQKATFFRGATFVVGYDTLT